MDLGEEFLHCVKGKILGKRRRCGGEAIVEK